MDSIGRISLFLEVVKHQSFIKAARSIGITGSAITKQIQSLEDDLGIRLLHRTTRQVTLTEAGALYSQKVRKALDEIDEAKLEIQDLKAHPKGVLKVNAPTSFGRQYLVSPLVDFARTYPDLQMEVDFDDRHVDIIAEGYDVVIRIGTLGDSSLIAKPLASCPLVLCASPSFIQHYGLPCTPDALSEYPSVLYNKHGHIPEWRYKNEQGKKGVVRLKSAFTANNAELMLQACLGGIGVCVLPIFTAFSFLQSAELVRLLPDYATDPERKIYAIYPQKKYLSSKVRLFIEHLSGLSKTFPW